MTFIIFYFVINSKKIFRVMFCHEMEVRTAFYKEDRTHLPTQWFGINFQCEA